MSTPSPSFPFVFPGAFSSATLGALTPAYDLPEELLFVLALATAGTTVVFALALAGYARRRTRPYLLVAAAIAALVIRSVVGFGTMYGHVPMGVHHLVEHGLDFLIAACVLAAVYLTGSPTATDGSGP